MTERCPASCGRRAGRPPAEVASLSDCHHMFSCLNRLDRDLEGYLWHSFRFPCVAVACVIFEVIRVQMLRVFGVTVCQ